ncbi:MAG: 50S ribosomal protein L29 [Firmicutes bacterium]|nr:50S ribosomal protein L29 [Bacillota bacterium]
MKVQELRDLTTEELKAKLKDLKQEHFNLRFSHATGQLSNPMMLNTVKKDIARAITILKEREAKSEKTKVEAK